MKTKQEKLPAILGKIFACCGKDPMSVINRVLIRDNKAVALDGYILAVRPVHSMDGVNTLIPADVAKKTHKGDKIRSIRT